MNLLATTCVTTDSSFSSSSPVSQRVKWLEPVPTRFYCPRSIYEDWESEKSGFPGVWLGDEIKSPGGSFTYQVQSGPCCRLYYGNGYAETHSFERGWKPKDEIAYARDPIGYGAIGKNWTRVGANYLSYLTTIVGSGKANNLIKTTLSTVQRIQLGLLLGQEAIFVNGQQASYQTVRWESPIDKNVEVAKVCTLVCPLVNPLNKKEEAQTQVDLVA